LTSGSRRVAILFPVYNREAILPSTLEALRSQVFTDYVIVAVDDASRDGSYDLLLAAAQEDPARWILSRNSENLGGTGNMNRCLAIQREKVPEAAYVVKVDSDDQIAPELIDRGVHVLDADSGAVLCHFRTLFRRGDSLEDLADTPFAARLEQLGWSRRLSHRMMPRDALCIFVRYDNFVSSSSGAIVRCSALQRLDWPWRDERFNLEDYELWSRLAEHGSFHYVSNVTVSVQRGDFSWSGAISLSRRQREARVIAIRAFFRSWRQLGPMRIVKLLPIVALKLWYLRGSWRLPSTQWQQSPARTKE